MNNTAGNRELYRRQLSACMANATDPIAAGDRWLRQFMIDHPNSDSLVNDLFAHWEAYKTGFARSESDPQKSGGLSAFLFPFVLASFIGLLSGVLAYVTLSEISLRIKITVGFVVAGACAALLIYFRAIHFYRMALYASGFGLISAPFYPNYSAGVGGRGLDHGPHYAAAVRSTSLSNQDIWCIAIGAAMVLIAYLVPTPQSK